MSVAARPRSSRIIRACHFSVHLGWLEVSNEFSSATHCSRHRHDCQSHCSVARIGPTTRAGQESAAVSPEIAATETTEWKRRDPTVALWPRRTSRIGYRTPLTGGAGVKLDSANKTRRREPAGVAKFTCRILFWPRSATRFLRRLHQDPPFPVTGTIVDVSSMMPSGQG